MYGVQGLPDKEMRLTSTAILPGQTVTVQVRIEFADADPISRREARYRLIRTCSEMPGEGDEFIRTNERLRLLRLTDRGEDEIEDEDGKDAEIAALLPLNLADVFFTNGDDVQRFIAGGRNAERERQDAVHAAIRQLLGLADVEAAEARLKTVARKMRRQLSETGGERLQRAQAELDEVIGKIEHEESTRQTFIHRKLTVEDQIRQDERELDGIKGIGLLDEIQARIHEIEQDIIDLGKEETDIRKAMKALLQSEDMSRLFMGRKLASGLSVLDNLADGHVIPGHSVEVLRDRLELGLCICGEPLSPGHPRYQHVSDLIEEQRAVAPRIHRLTALWHEARNGQNAARAATDSDRSVTQRAAMLRERFTKCIDRQRRKQDALEHERKSRDEIDEERVQGLTQRIQSNRGKVSGIDQRIGEVTAHLDGLQEQKRVCSEHLKALEKQVTLNQKSLLRFQIANDLLSLASGTLDRLKATYVHRVSSRMNDIFLNIVGADSNHHGNVYTGVNIDESNHDIVIHSVEGRTLDADTELNGAAQRALTLAFIWALMEVAEREAPRIIDTPLGMTSGAVKRRMVDILSAPTRDNGVSYQIVLFMTRSEIRDIEDLIKERSGVIATLTCSKDYPRDLIHDWSAAVPTVRVCACNHQQICSVCERRLDASSGGFARREEVGM